MILDFSTSDNETHKWTFAGLDVLSTLRHLTTHVPTNFRFFVALLYLNQCPLNSVLSKCLSLFVQSKKLLQNINHLIQCRGLWTAEQKHNWITHWQCFLEAGIKKPNMDHNVDLTSLI